MLIKLAAMIVMVLATYGCIMLIKSSTSLAVLEAILFPKMNRHYWNEVAVSKVMGRTSITLEMDDDQVD